MSDQIRISDSGELETVRTWDGEPLYSPASVQEGLFEANAFNQIRGQIAMSEPVCKKCGVPAEFPKYATPDMCGPCSDAAWARIEESCRDLPGVPGNDKTNVWD